MFLFFFFFFLGGKPVRGTMARTSCSLLPPQATQTRLVDARLGEGEPPLVLVALVGELIAKHAARKNGALPSACESITLRGRKQRFAMAMHATI